MVIKRLNICGAFSVITALLVMTASHAFAGIVTLNDTRRMMNVERHFDYIEDKNDDYTFEDVHNGKRSTNWVKNTHGGLNFGYTRSVIWVRGEIRNMTGSAALFMFEIAYPVIDDICVYIMRENGIKKLHMGDKSPFHERIVDNRNFLIPVYFERGESVKFIFKVKTTSSMQIPINVLSEDDLIAKAQNDLLGLSLYYGAMLIMALYNIFLFISIKESMYFYYVCYVFSMTLWAVSLNGIGFQYLWPNATVWNDQVIVFSLNGIVFFAAMFAANFLNAKKDWPKNYRVFRLLPFISFIMMLFSYVIPYRTGISLAIIVAVVTIVYGFVISMMRLFEGFKLAKIFLLAWAMVLTGGVVMAMSKFGLLPRNLFTETAVQIGSALEVALLSFALAHRLNLEKKERIEAQNIANIHERYARIAREAELINERKVTAARAEALEMQKKTTETLEMKILERRIDLNENLKKVRETHDKIMENLAYARMIQAAILPDPMDISGLFKEHSIFYAPRDIVGGDYYYIDSIENGVIVAVADCTGHGVPGAFMTLVANWELKRIVKGEKCYDPGEILVKMNRRIRKALKQDTEKSFSDDGLDMAICVLDREKRILTYAGARIDLRYVTNNEIHTIKGDKRSLGYIYLRGDYRYQVHHLPIASRISVYISTDGITDQPGEATQQRFGSNRLNDLISANSDLPLARQCEILKDTLMVYRGERDQVDDMTMVAFIAEF